MDHPRQFKALSSSILMLIKKPYGEREECILKEEGWAERLLLSVFPVFHCNIDIFFIYTWDVRVFFIHVFDLK